MKKDNEKGSEKEMKGKQAGDTGVVTSNEGENSSLVDSSNCIESVKELFDKVVPDLNPSSDFFYRGEPKEFTQTVPTLIRIYKELSALHGATDVIDLQLKLLHRLQRYTSQYRYDAEIQGGIANFVEWMCIAQHHVLPTLLLDCSINPLVGLFFAVDDPCSKYDQDDGRMWVMRLRSAEERAHITIYLGNERVEEGFRPADDKAAARVSLSDRLSQALENPFIVIPRVLTRRIESQAGRFVMSAVDISIDAITADFDPPWHLPLKCYRVPRERMREIREQLRMFRIHEGTMYADLDAYARYLRNGGL